ncbi:MAG: hypothetical protein ACI9W4_001203 [Rhodothermales bacterium]|jgi:hypothetical protein
MTAVLLFVALLLPQQVVSQTGQSLRGRVILASNNPKTLQPVNARGMQAASEAVEMVRAPELLVLGDPLWPISIARAAVSYDDAAFVARATKQAEVQTQSPAMTYEQVTAARRARGAGQPPILNLGKPDFSRPRSAGEQLELRDTSPYASQVGPAPIEAAPRAGMATVPAKRIDRASAEVATDEALPVAYQVEDKSEAFQVQQVSAADATRQRIVNTDETTLYFSDGFPVYLRHTPAGQGGCYLEFDFGLDGHRSILGNGGYWLEAPTFGGVALHSSGDDRMKLDLTHATVPGCDLPEKLDLRKNGRNWEAR